MRIKDAYLLREGKKSSYEGLLPLVNMRIKEGYLLREVAGNHVVVPTGQAALDFSGLITLNETGAFLWKRLAAEQTEAELVAALLAEYDVDEATAQVDTTEFVARLKAADLLA